MKLSKRQRRLWNYSLRQLKKNFSPGVPVEVHLVPKTRLKGLDADCGAEMKLGRLVKIVIRISQNDVWKVKYDSLMHEWAHAMEWEANWTDDSVKREHGETWGVWFAKIYQHLVDECWEDMKERKLLRRDQRHLD